MPLTGTFERTLDEKQRIALPKSFRDFWTDQPLYLVPGTDQSLALYGEQAFRHLATQLSSSPGTHDVRAYHRLLYAQAEAVEADGQGRIRVPARLAQLAGLTRDAVWLGVFDHAELWDTGRWQAYRDQKQPQFDQLAESVLRNPSS